MTAALSLLLSLIIPALTDARSLRSWSSAESVSVAEVVQGLNQRLLVDTTRPFALVNGERTSLRTALQDGHPEQLQCGLEFGGRLFILELEKNHLLLPKQPSVFYYLPNGTGVSLQEHPLTHCFYHGRVRGLPHSRAALSTCSGLRGVIALNATLSLELQPQEQETGSTVQETGSGEEPDALHLLFSSGRAEGVREASCGVTYTAPPTPPQLHHRRRRDILTETKYIELVLVVDHQEFLNYQKNNKTIIYRMLDVANQVDWFYRPLNVRVALTGLEIWSDTDKIHIEKNPTETLHNFLQWRSRDLLPRIRHDNAQLIMGGSFDGTTVGMASQSSMCSRDRSGGVNVDHLVSVLGVASTVAHELGHNLGMSHDSAERRCQCHSEGRNHGCIMEPSTGLLPGQSFSSCSLEDLSSSLLHGGGMCLFNVPRPESLLGGPRCGNLYLEPGEECDCGLIQECSDPCCNASTCRLVSGAQCSSDGVCCSDCQLRAAGSVCRLPLGECDLPEFCSGTSPHCPPNVYLHNGEPCLHGASYCYGGVCASLDQQCQTLWGPNSTQAPDVCFLSVNKQGNKFGNCGQLGNGSYLPCPDQDVLCGRVQCRGGGQRPLLGSAEILTTTVHSDLDQDQYQDQDLVCRGTYLHLGQDVSDPASVSPGTRCGPGKVCLDQKCQEDSVFRVEECRQKCHGHGVCNSNRNCHCDEGWAPPDCVSSGTGGSTDSGPTKSTRDSSPVRVALVILFLLVLPVLVLVLVWPRVRRLLRLGLLSQSKLRQHRTPRGDRRNVEQVTPLRFHALTPGDDVTGQAPPPGQARGRPAAPCKPLPPDPAPQKPMPPSRPLPPDPALFSQPTVPLKSLPLYPLHRHGNSITPEATFKRVPPLPPVGSSHRGRASQVD
ncbi:disintegrin and metalloproteinase domain-containing protein 15 isoform X1 [Periophthalmus magnuspinnatus]|uniref:disintegrin and metalloproteinase domain-containing protein 15 isoform X1 n=1 Tax=Periophthalmus magnuspinnatus TaxID=409849 RepID=UPI0024367AEE|nr:disintegrin and metalloproteinase domain-containing protein 15 isoform X1 [Periophthalmus magnuspinnatus]